MRLHVSPFNARSINGRARSERGGNIFRDFNGHGRCVKISNSDGEFSTVETETYDADRPVN